MNIHKTLCDVGDTDWWNHRSGSHSEERHQLERRKWPTFSNHCWPSHAHRAGQEGEREASGQQACRDLRAICTSTDRGRTGYTWMTMKTKLYLKSKIVKILGHRKIIDKLDVGLIPNQAFPSKARGDQRMCLTHFVQTPVTRFFLFFFFTRFKFEILYTHLSSSNYKSLEIRTQIWVN